MTTPWLKWILAGDDIIGCPGSWKMMTLLGVMDLGR